MINLTIVETVVYGLAVAFSYVVVYRLGYIKGSKWVLKEIGGD